VREHARDARERVFVERARALFPRARRARGTKCSPRVNEFEGVVASLVPVASRAAPRRASPRRDRASRGEGRRPEERG
jgi:hypothetical protein